MSAHDTSRITVLGGTGDQGFGLALRWAQAGRHVIIGSRVRERALEAAAKVKAELGAKAHVEGSENAEAATRANVVVLSVPYPAQVATLKSIREQLRPGQILVDLTVPLEATVGGSMTRTISVWAGSAAEQAAEYVPAGVHVVGAFHNVGAEALLDLAHPVDCDVIVCGDHADSRHALQPWVEAIPGCRYVDGGRLENARTIEALTALLIGINKRYKVKHAGIRITGLTP
jgi:NADPH-dependent F420 reductase